MNNREITYKRLISLGNYENESFEASMLMSEGDDYDKACLELQAYVERSLQLINIRRIDQAEDRRREREIAQQALELDKSIMSYKRKLAELEAKLDALGSDSPRMKASDDTDDVPF